LTGLVLLMVACGLVVIGACALATRWRHHSFALPDWAERDPALVPRPAVQLCWLLAVGGLAGGAVGALVVGPAGRLAMRLLAATSPDAAGLETEAQQTIGRITAGGTIGFVLFVGIPIGIAIGLIYVFVSAALPRGILGGLVYGALLLVVFGSTVDPLRAGNEDFDLLEPGWLAVATFALMALLTGVVTAVFAGRIATALPSPRPSWVWWFAPSAALTLLVFTALPVMIAIVAVCCLVFMVAKAGSPSLRDLATRRGPTILRSVLAVVVLVTLPVFVLALGDIVTD
jgi:hypothetical protein